MKTKALTSHAIVRKDIKEDDVKVVNSFFLFHVIDIIVFLPILHSTSY